MRSRWRWVDVGLASTAAAVVVASVVVASVVGGGGADTALAGTTPTGPVPAVTRAGLDPALVAGRGATVAFAEQEAEKAATNGTVIGPSREAYTLPAEASGRSAVQLAPGTYVEFTLPSAANAITVRYSIPDAPGGGGINAPLDVRVNNGPKRTMTLTSQYAWLYNQYPFTNDPDAGQLHPDRWVTECQCVPGPDFVVSKPFRPMHLYDEQRMLLGKTYPAGSTVRLTAPPSSNAAWTVIDLLDSELVGRPYVNIFASNVLLFGADPTGRRDSANAFDHAIAFAKRAKLKVYIPPGVLGQAGPPTGPLMLDAAPGRPHKETPRSRVSGSGCPSTVTGRSVDRPDS